MGGDETHGHIEGSGYLLTCSTVMPA